jgi:Flp pilus assembly pilin Flp
MVLNRRRGQTLTENGLIIALVAILILSSLTIVGASVTGVFTNITNAINGSVGPTSSAGGGSGTLTYSWATSASAGTITWSDGAAGTPPVIIPAADLYASAGTQTISLTVSDGTQSVTQSVNLAAPLRLLRKDRKP